LFDPRNVLNVIDMPMGEQKKFQIDPARTEPVGGALRGVEEDGAGRGLEQVAIRLENAAAKGLVSHVYSWPTGSVAAFVANAEALKPGARRGERLCNCESLAVF
jgi:hypothetical protein